MKIKSLILVFLLLSSGLSCRLLLPNQDMFDQETLRKVFAAVKEKGVGKEPLHEIEITYNEVYFSTYTERWVYSRGFLQKDKSKSRGEAKPFQIAETDSFDLSKVMTAALEFAKKNSYLKNPSVSRYVITKQTVMRDDNLVSNVGKKREAMRCDVYLTDTDTPAHYTTNLQGELVDVAETNVKPRLVFFDAAQMQKSIAEIKPLFGGKLSVSQLNIQIENFYFTAADPKNLNEINHYRMSSHEFLRAGELNPAFGLVKSVESNLRQMTTKAGESNPAFGSSIPFDVDKIDFSLIPKVMQKTLESVKMTNAKVSMLRILIPVDQFNPQTEIEWQVEAYGDRSEKETVIFDRQGNLKKAS